MTTQSNLLPPRSSTPFFRRPSLTNSLSSNSTSQSDSSSNSSSGDSEPDSDSSSDYPRRTSFNRHSSWSSTESSSVSFPTASTSPSNSLPLSPPSTIKRSDLKLSLTYLRARQSLLSSSYDTLSQSLRTLSTLLPSSPSNESWKSIGVFVPILERFIRDLRRELGGEEKANKEYRRQLGKEDAKALVGLRQRWVGGGTSESKGKNRGKEKDTGLDWVVRVEELVRDNRPPDIVSPVDNTVTSLQTASLLTSIESLLLPSCSSPRISLQNLQLTTSQLSQWTALEHIQETIEWYLSFSGIQDQSELPRKARNVLESVKSLDLSRNQLTSFPSYLPYLFPSLESLSLSHNSFTHLSPSLTLFSNLRRLKIHGNPLVQSHKALLPLNKDSCQAQRPGKGTRSNVRQIIKTISLCSKQSPTSPSTENGTVRSLFSLSLDLLYSLHLSPSSLPLPPHLLDLLSSSYTCISCSSFVLPSSPSFISPFFERLHFLSPGINLPSSTHTRSSPALEEGSSRATLEQLVLLVAYQRVENPPQTTSKRFLREDEARRREKRGGGLETIVVGGEGWRFCFECAGRHLGVNGREGECKCGVCEEERRVRESEGEGGQRTMRWLRRKEKI